MQSHLKGNKAETLLHIANMWRREFLTETDLRKDVLHIGFNRNILIDQSNLFCIEGKLGFVDIYAAPELLDLSLNA